MAAKSRYHDKLVACGQGHVFEHWESLSPQEREALEKQVEELDAITKGGVEALQPLLLEELRRHEEVLKGTDSSNVRSAPDEWVGKADGSDPAAEARWERLGLEAVAKGACAACVLAGGMGTRLGASFPKGMLGDPETAQPFLPSNKSLFQVQAERIRRVQRLAQEQTGMAEEPTILYLVMTSEQSHELIVGFFERRDFFGLRKEQVMFFKQGFMPCFGYDGKVLMETTSRIASSPDGNAGIYPALQRSGALDRMKASGVKWLQVFSVDNVLVRVADPVWYGFCEETGADVSVKTVAKRDWAEPVGVVVLRGDLPGVIEYSEIGEARAKETLPSGELRYNASNICLQAYSVDFLCGPVQEFKTVWHIAKKDIPTVGGKVPGVKLEGFIFDVFEKSKTFRLLQVDRAAEFSAIKNASDSGKQDTPQTALESLSRLHRRWLRAAGAALPEEGADGRGPVCEVSPLVSYRGEGLEAAAKAVDCGKEPIEVK